MKSLPLEVQYLLGILKSVPSRLLEQCNYPTVKSDHSRRGHILVTAAKNEVTFTGGAIAVGQRKIGRGATREQSNSYNDLGLEM